VSRYTNIDIYLYIDRLKWSFGSNNQTHVIGLVYLKMFLVWSPEKRILFLYTVTVWTHINYSLLPTFLT